MGAFHDSSLCVLVSFLLIVPIVAATGAPAQVLVNELYYDHPGADSGHEYIELINVSTSPVASTSVCIEFHNGSGDGWDALWCGDSGEINAGRLFVLGGSLVVPLPDVTTGLSLQNGPDAVRVLVDGVVTDVVGYGGLDDAGYVETRGAEPIAAGMSLGRFPDGHDTGDNSTDLRPLEPSPGAFNLPHLDVSVAAVVALRARDRAGAEMVTFRLRNEGANAIAAGSVGLVVRDSTDAGVIDMGAFSNASVIGPGDEALVHVEVMLGTGYHWIIACSEMPGDERPRNDRATAVRRVGDPGVLISEILSSPPGECPQFVELHNLTDTPVRLDGYGLRDEVHESAPISNEPQEIPVRGFLVITADRERLLAYFPDAPPERVIAFAGSWPTINRSGTIADSVVVSDAVGLPVDRVAVPGAGSAYAGRSFERVDLFVGDGDAQWVLSTAPGGASPGFATARSLTTPPPAGRLTASPNPFSPYDGETLQVAIASGAERADASVFDPMGRLIADLGSTQGFPAVFVWDGVDDYGNVVTPGIYVVACEIWDGNRRSVARVVVGSARMVR